MATRKAEVQLYKKGRIIELIAVLSYDIYKSFLYEFSLYVTTLSVCERYKIEMNTQRMALDNIRWLNRLTKKYEGR